MNGLRIVDFNGIETVDSRDVAAMVDRSHNDLLKTIRVYIGYLREGEFAQSDFFIESTYLNAQNHETPCYLITKRGCDMIANKTTGPKGVVFTAAYVDAFERMRTQLQAPMSPAELLAAQAQLLVDMERKVDAIEAHAQAIEEHTETRAQALEARVDNAVKVFSRPAQDHWKTDMDEAVKELCRTYHLSVPATKGRMYDELERTANCNINSRLARLRQRKKKGGARSQDIAALNKLDAVAADKQLRTIYEGIVRRWQAEYCSQ